MRRYFKKIRQLSLVDYSLATPASRAQERHRRMILGVFGAAWSKGAGVIAQFILVRLTFNYLGAERFGIWMALLSLVWVLLFADFGIGTGMMNRISAAYGRADEKTICQTIGAAYSVLTLLAVLLAMLFVFVSCYVPWAYVLGIKEPVLLAEAVFALRVFVCIFMLNVPLGLIQRVQFGLQDSAAAGIWQSFFHVGSLLALFFAMRFSVGLPGMVAVYLLTQSVSLLGNTVWYFRRNEERQPHWHFSIALLRGILADGFWFFLLQFGILMAGTMDVWLVTRALGPTVAGEYGILQRMYGVLPLILGFLLPSLTAVYGEAAARQDIDWIKNMLWRSTKWSLFISSSLALLFVFMGNWLITLWTGKALNISLNVLILMGVWGMIESVGQTISVYLNGTGRIVQQLPMVYCYAGLVVVIKLLWLSSVGLILIPTINGMLYLLIMILGYYVLLKRYLLF